MTSLRNITALIGAAAAAATLSLAALTTAGTAGATVITPTDDVFLHVITDAGIQPSSQEEAIATADDVCVNLGSGATVVDAVYGVSDHTGLPVEDSAFFVGASIAAYCPQYKSMIS